MKASTLDRGGDLLSGVKMITASPSDSLSIAVLSESWVSASVIWAKILKALTRLRIDRVPFRVRIESADALVRNTREKRDGNIRNIHILVNVSYIFLQVVANCGEFSTAYTNHAETVKLRRIDERRGS